MKLVIALVFLLTSCGGEVKKEDYEKQLNNYISKLVYNEKTNTIELKQQ